MDGGPHRRQGSLSLVLFRVHHLFGAVRARLVCGFAHRISYLTCMAGGLMAPMAQMIMARAAGRHLAKVFGYVAIRVRRVWALTSAAR